MNKEFFVKNRKVFLVSFAVLFIALMFLVKTKSTFTNIKTATPGLTYAGNETIGDLVNEDTDSDGILDWEESLWGTNPTKVDTDDDGTSDNVEIAKLKGNTLQESELNIKTEENLTETDKFSREFFSTVTALNQTGGLDQNTVDKLSSSLAEQINNPVTKKVFTISDIKTSSDVSIQAIQNYNNALENLLKKYPTVYTGGVVTPIVKTFAEILQKYLNSNDDASILLKLDPTIKDIRGIIDGILKTSVPDKFSALHLNLINGFERVLENLNDIKKIDSDPIVAIGATSKFPNNISLLQGSIDKLITAINQDLGR